MVLFYARSVDKSRRIRDAGHRRTTESTSRPRRRVLGANMSPTAPGAAALAAPARPLVLTGTPVVPGVALGPVVRPSGGVRLPSEDLPAVREDRRVLEKARFAAAAGTVAERLERRAAAATGVSAEVLT